MKRVLTLLIFSGSFVLAFCNCKIAHVTESGRSVPIRYLVPFKNLSDSLESKSASTADSLLNFLTKNYSFKYFVLRNYSNYCELKDDCLFFKRCTKVIDYLESKGFDRKHILIEHFNMVPVPSVKKELDEKLSSGKSPKEVCDGFEQGVLLTVIEE